MLDSQNSLPSPIHFTSTVNRKNILEFNRSRDMASLYFLPIRLDHISFSLLPVVRCKPNGRYSLRISSLLLEGQSLTVISKR